MPGLLDSLPLPALGELMADILRAVADDTEKSEPYATNSINALRQAADTIWATLQEE